MAKPRLTSEQRKINKRIAGRKWAKTNYPRTKALRDANPILAEQFRARNRQRDRERRIAVGLPVREILGPRITEAGRLCSKCRERKSPDQFYPSQKSADGIHTMCAECCKSSAKVSAAKYPEKRRADRRKFQLAQYGLTPIEFDRMFAEQNGDCGICRKKLELEAGKCTVDHRHEDGSVRGLLCHQCNLGIGLFRDDPALMREAAAYLERTLSSKTNQPRT